MAAPAPLRPNPAVWTSPEMRLFMFCCFAERDDSPGAHSITQHGRIQSCSLNLRQRRSPLRSTSGTSKSDMARVRAMSDRDIVLSAEHPEASLKHVVRGIVRRGLKPVPPKASISLRLDADVLEWLKAQGPGYQTRINAILRAFKEASA
jgi:uncharacterized protein (DUF4415 family)